LKSRKTLARKQEEIEQRDIELSTKGAKYRAAAAIPAAAY
jgi:hypothetical protein